LRAENNAKQEIETIPINNNFRAKINFKTDYKLLRVGIKKAKKYIIVEYEVPSSKKRFHHVIKLEKYCPEFISKELNDQEINTII
jgi:hypothetical protein